MERIIHLIELLLRSLIKWSNKTYGATQLYSVILIDGYVSEKNYRKKIITLSHFCITNYRWLRWTSVKSIRSAGHECWQKLSDIAWSRERLCQRFYDIIWNIISDWIFRSLNDSPEFFLLAKTGTKKNQLRKKNTCTMTFRRSATISRVSS